MHSLPYFCQKPQLLNEMIKNQEQKLTCLNCGTVSAYCSGKQSKVYQSGSFFFTAEEISTGLIHFVIGQLTFCLRFCGATLN